MKRIFALGVLLALLSGAALPARADKTVTLTFTGDVTLGSEEKNRDNPNSFDSYANREGYDWFFRNMKDLFSSDDLTLVNLEGVLSDKSFQENKKKTFRFRGPTDFAKILTQSSIEACAISNNHIMDFGTQGYQNTMETLRSNGILFCGNDHSFVFEKDGVKIGFFALGSSYVARYRNYVTETVAQMREAGVGAIIFSFHTGQEYSPKRRNWDQEKYAKMAVEEWGADLVVMHHPHVLQGVDILDNRYVFYSLGNFCFGGNMAINSLKKDRSIRTLETAVLQVDMTFSDTGEYLGQRARIYPCYMSSSASDVGDPNDFQPKFVTGEEALGVFERIQYDTKFDLGLYDEEDGYLSLPWLDAAAEPAESGTAETGE